MPLTATHDSGIFAGILLLLGRIYVIINYKDFYSLKL